jgi:DNA mismatch endonuclease, patch repair protein
MYSEFVFETTPETRRRNMRAIKSRRNKTTERRLRAFIVASGISGWRMHGSGLPGCPDFFFETKKIAIFVDGCFWHSCPKCGHTPKANRSYWSEKLARNKRRDAKVNWALRSRAIRVIRLWECDLRCQPNLCLRRIFRALRRP